jgi:rfaE bifunctional protein nucleotidyltransferase chain/domain
MSIIHSIEDLQREVADWKAQGHRVGFTCGTFDFLHVGHVDYLEQARRMCDRLIVAVNSDSSVRAYKDPMRPINTHDHRIAVVSALSCVDAAILMHASRPEVMIKALQPDFYIKGGDYNVEHLRSASLVESYGGHCAIVPLRHEISTTQIIRRIQDLARYEEPEREEDRRGDPIVFLDRDGTIIRNIPFLRDQSRVELLPGVGEGLRRLQDFGFRLVVVTNQQGIGLGYFDYDAFVKVNTTMLHLLNAFGVKISRFYFCPHSMADDCDCRKPGTRLVEQALCRYGVTPERCFFIGDSATDIECALRAGCIGIRIGSNSDAPYDASVHGFQDAVKQIEAVTISETATI